VHRLKYPIYERLDPAPPLFANALLFLLFIFISRHAFKNYRTLEDVLAARALKGKYQIMEWADNALGSLVFLEITVDGLTEKAKTASSWSHKCLDWAKRADFPNGIGLHATRREALIQVDSKCF
jgi:hypothetical protein